MSMALRAAVVALGLASRLVLADPGSLRGAQEALDAAPDLAAAPPGVAQEVAATAVGNASATAGGAVGDVQAEDSFTRYWDGQCLPRPARLYKHCSQGGKLAGTRSCCKWGSCLYSEGQCQMAGPPGGGPPGPINIMTLYHETSPQAAAAILASAFRPGNSGWCGGAVYFYGSPDVPATKLGPDSQTGAVIEAKVNMGRMATLDSKCEGVGAARLNYDSVTFNPGDGNEFVIFSSDRVISMKLYSSP